MKGSINIIVQNDRIKYEFLIRRNITILKGDSATGKTSLIDMIREYNLQGIESGIELFCEKNCAVIEGNLWEKQLSYLQDSIVFIDEGNRFMSSVEFAKAIQQTDNYYVLVTREGLETLPYSIEEIYGIRSNRKYGGLTQTYHEMYHIYKNYNMERNDITKILTEDSNSGYQFFAKLCADKNIACISANGKSNICQEIIKHKEDNLLIIADGAAFGSEMEKVIGLMKNYEKIALYLPESFEWLILKAGVIDDKELREMSKDWGSYIESKEFFSWEQFFTHLLIEKTQGSYLQYNKRKINSAYLKGDILNKLLQAIKVAWERK